MVTAGIFLLFTLILSEYGFRSRAAAVASLAGPWRAWHTLLRAALWASAFVLTANPPFQGSRLSAAFFLFLYGEFAAWMARSAVRLDLSKQRRHGSPLAHLMPLGACVLLVTFFGIIRNATGISEQEFPLPPIAKVIAGAAAFTALFTWSTLFTLSIVETVRPAPVDERRRMGAGEVIGLLERLLVFSVVLNGQLAAAGFVIAAKTIVRFHSFREEDLADYFLIGTLASVGVAAVAAMLVRLI